MTIAAPGIVWRGLDRCSIDGESRVHGLLERATLAAIGPDRQWLRPAIFRRPCGALQRETK
jgi:hypothetical protein